MVCKFTIFGNMQCFLYSIISRFCYLVTIHYFLIAIFFLCVCELENADTDRLVELIAGEEEALRLVSFNYICFTGYLICLIIWTFFVDVLFSMYCSVKMFITFYIVKTICTFTALFVTQLQGIAVCSFLVMWLWFLI